METTDLEVSSIQYDILCLFVFPCLALHLNEVSFVVHKPATLLGEHVSSFAALFLSCTSAFSHCGIYCTLCMWKANRCFRS